jgi:hypothetical protein
MAEIYANQPDPPTPDRGGVPRNRIAYSNNLGMSYAPIVPKRRKPMTGGKGFHRLTVGFHGEAYHFIFPAAMSPSDVMIAAHEWAENPELAFNGLGEDAVMDLLIERESMRE